MPATKSSTSPVSPVPRGTKRSSSTVSSGDDSKKARGRPRVEPQDETAADRRRTQIRLAQRTYRQRKESTITTLQTKVSQLETIILEMHSSFQDITQAAVTSSIGEADPSFARRFADATKQFDQLARDAKADKKSSRAHSDDWDSEEPVEEVKATKRGHTNRPSSKPSVQKQETVAKQRVPNIVSQGQRGIPSVWGYETIYGSPRLDEPEETTTEIDIEAFTQTTAQALQPSYNGTVAAPVTGYFDQFSGPLTSYAWSGVEYQGPLTPHFELPLPTTVAYQETSFGRRLHRSVLESAVRLLNQPFVDPKILQAKFSYVMRHASQAEVSNRLYKRLLKAKTEPLESNIDHSRVSSLGPFAQQNWKISPEYRAQIDYFDPAESDEDGAWYTPTDVQTYIEAKGVYIDPSASVVEWETAITTPHGAKGYSPVSTSQSDPTLYGTPTSLDSTMMDFNAKNQSIMPRDNLMNMPQFTGDSMAQLLDYMPSPSVTPDDLSENHPEPTHKRVTMNVNTLIGELINAAVCLGPSPGFRLRHVERALRKSITSIVAF